MDAPTVPETGSKGNASEKDPNIRPAIAQSTKTRKLTVARKNETVAKEKEEMGREGERELESIDEESEGSGRESWFYQQREYPLTTIPRMAVSNAIAHMEREQTRLRGLRPFTRNARGVQVSPESLPAWQSLGPKPIGAGHTFGVSMPVSGRVTAIALDPGYDGVNNRTVYVGASQGGVWKSTDNGATWTPILDDQPSLAIGAIAIDPTNPNTIYVGTGEPNFSFDSYYGAGLLKTTNGGASWTQIQGPASPGVPGAFAFMNVVFPRIVVDPTSPSTIYAVTNANGHTSGSSGGGGIATLDQRGIWKSADGGATWINLNPLNTNPAGQNSGTDVLLDPQNPSTVFAAIQSQGIFESDQGGTPGTWQRVGGTTLPAPGTDSNGRPLLLRILLASGPPIAPSAKTTLYAVYAAFDGKDLLGIFRSTDGGANWVNQGHPTSGQTNFNLALAVDPKDANTLYYGTQTSGSGGTVFRSSDGGQTYTDISVGDGSGGLHPDTHVLVINPSNPSILFTGDDGGIWRTNNAKGPGAVSWVDLNPGLSITQFQGLALHPTDPNKILGGTQDNGTNLFSGQSTWSQVISGDSGFTLIDQSNPLVMYHTFFNRSSADGIAQIGPQISFTGGTGWQNRGCFNCVAQIGNFNPADNVSFYAPMALNTGFMGQNGNVVYFGTNRLYRTADRGTTWTGLGASSDGFGTILAPNIQVGSPPVTINGFISAITAFRFSSNLPSSEIVWIGTNTGLVQITTNAGALGSATFTDVTKAALPNRFVTDIAVDLVNSQRAIVTYSGFNANTPPTPGHVFITNDLGTSWTDISGNLPDVPVTSIAINPDVVGTYYIGTDIGVFETRDGGTTWVALLDGMPKVAVYMIRYHAATKSLVAATHGRGMFRLDVSSEIGNPVPSVTGILPTSAAVASGACTLTVNGGNFVNGATVLWNGQARTTTFNSSSQLQAQIPGTDLSAAGTVTVTVSNPTPGGGTSTSSSTFTVTKGSQTINFGALVNKTFGDAPFNVTASSTAGLPVTFSVLSGPATMSGNTVTLTGAGSVTIQADQAGNSNFNPATPATQTFTVARQSQTIAFTQPGNHTYGDPTFLISASSTSGLPVSFSVISGEVVLSGNEVTVILAGPVTIQADQAGNANFSAAPAVQRTFTIAKANQTITLGPLANRRVGDPRFTIDATSSSGLQVNFSLVTGSATVVFNFVQFLEHVGTVVIQADQPGDINFNPAAPVQQSFTVGKGQAFIDVTNFIQMFDGDPKGVWATTTPPELSGLTVTYNGSTTPPSAIDSYGVIASLNNPDYQASNFIATLKIIGFSPTDSQNASPGGQNTASINPGGSSPGISANLNHSNSGVTATVSVGIYSDNPTERGLVNVGSGFVDVKVSNPNADDTVVINYYYPSSITAVNEAALQLYYFNGLIWLPVRGSGNSVPTKDTTDNLDGTVSGGRFTVTLDNTSSPKVSGLTGTVFAATTAIMGDINADNVVNVSDLVLMANILAGNTTPTAIQKDAADVSKDQTNHINVSDLVTLANFLAGNIKTLPVGQ